VGTRRKRVEAAGTEAAETSTSWWRGATEIDYLRHLKDEYGRNRGFHLNVKANPAAGYTPRQALDPVFRT
jgi:hypothetical protein